LFNAAMRAGGPAARHRLWGLTPGARADALVIDTHTPGLLGIPDSHTLDALVFGCDTPAIRDVYVAGNRVIANGRHAGETAIANGFKHAMDALWDAERTALAQ
jgi:formimidoylglutamate deiminase